MATKRKKSGSATRAANRSQSNAPTASTTAAAGLPTAVPSGSILRANPMPPAGLFTNPLALEADVSQEFADLAPTFGDVLLSIGEGVAQSQDALDQGLVETARVLSDTKITVVTDVIQKLDDDGLPVAEDTELVAHEVSLINYVNPTVHEWSHVALSMDLSVGAMDFERGVSFNRTQSSGGTSGYGLFWGFLGWFSHSQRESEFSRDSNVRQEADWARGQVRVDAQLRPRDIERFPTPAEVNIGPQIYFSMGSVAETTAGGVVTARNMDIVIHVRKANGDENPTVPLDLDAGPFRFSFEEADGFTGSTTNADGQCKVTITRDIPNARFLRALTAPITVTLGDLKREVDITL